MTIGRLIIAAALMLTAFLPSPRAETLLGSTISEEVFLYMKVNPEAAQALLPERWTLAPWTKGAWAGANLLIILGETHSDLDPEGKPRRDTRYLNMRLFTWGRSETVKWRIFNTHRFATDNLTPSSATRVSTAELRRSGSRVSEHLRHAAVSDLWEMAAGGGTLRLQLSYAALTPRFSTQKGKLANPEDPEGVPVSFRIKQLSYMILGLNRPKTVETLELTNSVPALAPLLDGTEEILSIRILPVKMTERFRP
jgi:hypothetical protein